MRTRNNNNTPKQQRSIKSKEAILKQAREVFSQKGYHGARIDEIAEAAGINKQRIYAYFGSKQDLYHTALLEVYSEAARQEKIMKLTSDDIPELTYKLVSAFLEFHRSHPDFWRLLSWENINHGHNLSEQDWSQIRYSYISHIEKLFLEGQEKGIFKAEINFSAYIMTVFAITFFYYSNQITISQLLNIDLETELTKQSIVAQVSRIVDSGLKV